MWQKRLRTVLGELARLGRTVAEQARATFAIGCPNPPVPVRQIPP